MAEYIRNGLEAFNAILHGIDLWTRRTPTEERDEVNRKITLTTSEIVILVGGAVSLITVTATLTATLVIVTIRSCVPRRESELHLHLH